MGVMARLAKPAFSPGEGLRQGDRQRSTLFGLRSSNKKDQCEPDTPIGRSCAPFGLIRIVVGFGRTLFGPLAVFPSSEQPMKNCYSFAEFDGEKLRDFDSLWKRYT